MAIFPGAISTDSDLYIAVNTLSALLTDNPLTIGATTVNVNSTALFPTVGFISIDAEIIKYTGKTATSFTGCTRGADGSTAAAHSVGAQVDHNVIAAHHNVLKDEVIATEQFISDLIGRTNTQIRTPAGSAAVPSHSFAGDTDTGLYNNAANEVAVTTGGVVSTLFTALGVNSAKARLDDGTAALPAFTFQSDTDTGIFRPGANRLGFSTGGAEHWEVTSAGDLSVFAGTERLIISDGTVGSPALQFANDPDTGIYRSGANDMRLVTAGGSKLQIDASFLYPLVQIQSGDGTNSAPTYSFFSDPDTGMYRSAANTMNWATNGAARMSLDTTSLTINLPIYHQFGTLTAPGISFSGGTTVGLAGSATTLSATVPTGGDFEIRINSNQIVDVQAGAIFLGTSAQSTRLRMGYDGTAASPVLTWDADPDTGIYRSGTNEFAITSGGAIAAVFVPTGDNFYVGGVEIVNVRAAGLSTINGTAASPSFYFLNDTDTGFYRTGSNAIGVALGGAVLFDFNTTVNRSFVTFQPSTDNAYTLGSNAARWTSVHATNGTIQTSHSSTKQNIVEVEDLEVPKGVLYERDGRKWLGYLNDSLPVEGRPINPDGSIELTANYEQAVIGILCAAVRKLQKEVASLKN